MATSNDVPTGGTLPTEIADLLRKPLTMERKLAFWMAYLKDSVPPQYTIATEDPVVPGPQKRKSLKRRVGIRIEFNGQTIMHGMIHRVGDAAAAQSKMQGEADKSYLAAYDRVFFLGDARIHFYRVLSETVRDASFDPVKDVCEVRKRFKDELERLSGPAYVEPTDEQVQSWLDEGVSFENIES